MNILEKLLAQIALPNPLNAENFAQLLAGIVKLLTQIGIALAPIAILFAGILFMTAQGDEGKIRRAKEVIFWAVIGIIVILSADAIVAMLQEFLKQS